MSAAAPAPGSSQFPQQSHPAGSNAPTANGYSAAVNPNRFVRVSGGPQDQETSVTSSGAATAGQQEVSSGPRKLSPQEQQQQQQATFGANGSQQKTQREIPTGKRKILRKKQPAKKNYTKGLWLFGHIVTFTFGFAFFGLYFLNFRNRRSPISRITYRVSLLGAVLAYTMSIISKFGLALPSGYTLITTENFQYLLLVYVWFFTRESVFKLLPYVIISFLHLSKRFNLIHKYPNGLVRKLAEIISYNELALIVVLFVNTLLFRGTSGYALVAFLSFYWLRIVYSDSTKAFFKRFTRNFKANVISKAPPNVQEYYDNFLRRIEFRENEVDKVFVNIHQTNKKTEAAAKGEIDTSKDKQEDKAFATGPKVTEPVDVNISAETEEPEDNKK